MIPRYQKVLFFLLLVVSIAMTVILVRLREQAHERLLRGEDIEPTSAPAVADAEQATLVVANDADGTLSSQLVSLPLPKDDGARARALLEKLLEFYSSPQSSHPLSAAERPVAQVFLLPINDPKTDAPQSDSTSRGQIRDTHAAPAQLAVVNLTSAFADGHPSGIQTEMLTVLSICATLHVNLPAITQVRFLVDGAERKNLAGHADLTRTYLTAEAVAIPAASTPAPSNGAIQ
jgi:hypothetical protein